MLEQRACCSYSQPGHYRATLGSHTVDNVAAAEGQYEKCVSICFRKCALRLPHYVLQSSSAALDSGTPLGVSSGQADVLSFAC